ncbi:MAG: sensor histidine kinase [Peptococcaceae bacterium]|nr:sensor histidine kinase [Peptococcaceae bacterium]
MKTVDIKALDEIIKKTIEAIEHSKKEIYEIVQSTDAEYQRVMQELEEVRQETRDVIALVDKLTYREKQARIRLMEVSKDFRKYSEEDIKEAYEQAQNLQLELVKLREQEKLLRYRRDHLELSLKRLKRTRERADALMSQVGVVLNYLAGDLQGISDRLDEVYQFQKLRFRIIEAQEEERRRVAREIHDGPAQSMANIVMRADFCTKLIGVDPDKLREELEALQELVRTSLADVRNIIFDLRPMALDDLGLGPALKRFVERFQEQHNILVDFMYFGKDDRIDATIEVALFRIVQEALNNVQKHAKAKQVAVKVEVLPERVNVFIKDNGRGFDVDRVMGDKDGKGYGLVGMKERVELLRGNLKIRSKPGQGTTIVIMVPLTKD